MTDLHQQLHPDALYWSVVRLASDAPPTKIRAQRPERFNHLQIADLIEQQLPGPVENFQLAGVRVGACVVTCGVLRAELAQLTERETELVSLIPSALADCVVEAAPEFRRIDPATLLPAFELLTGDFLPTRIRRLRQRRFQALASTIAIASLVLAGSWVRSAARARSDAAQAQQARDQSLSLLVQPGLGPDGSPESDAGRFPTDSALATAAFSLASEISAARAATPRVAANLDDAATILAGFLAQWPEDSTVAVDQLSVQQGATFVQCAFESRAQADAFASSFHPPSGWTSDPPRMHAAGPRTVLTLRFIPNKEGRP